MEHNSHIETERQGSRPPLYGSVWLALFYLLRESLISQPRGAPLSACENPSHRP